MFTFISALSLSIACLIGRGLALINCPSYGTAYLSGVDGNFHVLNITIDKTANSHALLNIQLRSAYDQSILSCHAVSDVVDTGSVSFAGNCSYPPGGPMGNVVTTVFQLSLQAANAKLKIEQRFSCNKNGYDRPWRFFATTDHGWDIRMNCNDSGNLCTYGKVASRDNGTLDTFVLEMPSPALTNCTAASESGRITWDVDRFNYTPVTPASPAPAIGIPPDVVAIGSVTATFYFHDIDLFVFCNINSWTLGVGNPAKYDTDPWYDCATGKSEYAEPVPPTRFKFNRTTGSLTLEQTWTCDDAGAPHNYTGIATTILPGYPCSAGRRTCSTKGIVALDPVVQSVKST